MQNIKNIVTYITHDTVDSWNFLPRHGDALCAGLSGVEVTICRSEAEFIAALEKADCVLVWRFRQEWFENAPRLRLISTPAAGKDYFHIVPPENVKLMYGSFHGQLIGETVVGMLLGMTRGICHSLTNLIGEEWPRQQLCASMRPLRGSHVVILGLGSIGARIGGMLKPFGVRISGMRRSTSRAVPEWFTQEDRIFTENELDVVLPTADHIILALPGTTDTDDILDERRISFIQRNATIINIGRGNAINEKALCSALLEGRLAGAFLDVFKEEPLPMESVFRRCPNLWRLPHASAISPNYLDLYVEDLLRQLREDK